MNRLKSKPTRVAVGISGGVDSAVAASLLQEQGYNVIGVHLYCYDEGPYCTAKEDRVSAVRVAKHLGIPLKVWDLRKEYRELVISYFFDEYRAGRTPNPDVVCNREIKFGLFMEKALRELRVNYIATGHYARVARQARGKWSMVNSEWLENKSEENTEPTSKPLTINYKLLTGRDTTKDQSYFLYTLTQEQLGHILFPIGDYRKEEVRKMAKEMGLPNHKRPDSMGVCFIGPVPISRFLRENLPAKIGSVVNTKGEIIGEHDGVWFFTEGQRHGFKLFSAKGGSSPEANAPREHASGGKNTGLPLYVIRKNVATNTLVVGRGEESKVREFLIDKPHWIQNQKSKIKKQKLGVRIRHLGELLPATVSRVNQSTSYLVNLRFPATGVAPGQSAVFYRGEEVLGGGVISKISSKRG